jgi:hypothetical protein
MRIASRGSSQALIQANSPLAIQISLARKSSSLPGTNYPWRCLCFAFSQITRTTPRRVTTLHFAQIFFTDARTFIFTALLRASNSGAKLQNHL